MVNSRAGCCLAGGLCEYSQQTAEDKMAVGRLLVDGVEVFAQSDGRRDRSFGVQI